MKIRVEIIDYHNSGVLQRKRKTLNKKKQKETEHHELFWKEPGK
jgi:hypothetical protein